MDSSPLGRSATTAPPFPSPATVTALIDYGDKTAETAVSWAHEQVAKGEYACLLASTKAAENEANCKEKPGLADAASAVARVSEEVLAEAQRKAAGKAGAPHSSVFGHPAAQQATECPIEAHQTLARAIDKYNVLHDAAARDAKSAAAAAAASDAGPGVPKEAKQKPINKIDSTVMRKLLFERERITPAVALAALDKYPVPESTRKNVQRTAKSKLLGSCLGIVSARSYGVLASSETKEWPHLAAILAKLARQQFGDAFEFTSIQVNKNYASALHVDGNNNGASKIIGLGDFSGGGLWASGKGALDCRNKWHEFDGNLPHCTLPFTGTRYTLIYFVQNQCQSCFEKKPHHAQYVADLGFTFPPNGVPSAKSLTYATKPKRMEAGRAEYANWCRERWPDLHSDIPDTAAYEARQEADDMLAAQELHRAEPDGDLPSLATLINLVRTDSAILADVPLSNDDRRKIEAALATVAADRAARLAQAAQAAAAAAVAAAEAVPPGVMKPVPSPVPSLLRRAASFVSGAAAAAVRCALPAAAAAATAIDLTFDDDDDDL